MRMTKRARRGALGLTGVAVLALAALMTIPPTPSTTSSAPARLTAQTTMGVGYAVGRINDVSAGCPGTGDISDAADPARHYVYQEFEGCDHDNGVGFARSVNGGKSYGRAAALPGSDGGWDPWLAVASNGTLYAAFMNTIGTRTYPVIDVSHNYGRTFTVEHSLKPAQGNNWGDADYLAIGPNGTLYVSWGYGPSNSEANTVCSPTASCWSTKGDLNVVVQRSTNGGKTFSPMSVVTPGYPDAGADEGDFTVAPDGAIDVLYQGYQVVNGRTLALAHGHEYFTTSTNGGRTWSKPVEVGAAAGQITINEWWNDGYISADSAGDLYATWDTQGSADLKRTDTGWVSFSSDGGRTWSAPVQATPDSKDVPHIMESVGAGKGQADVGWVTDTNPRGYALYLRAFDTRLDGGAGGWLSKPVRVSQKFGNSDSNPGDTFGIVAASPGTLQLGWGGALPGSGDDSSVSTARVRVYPSGHSRNLG